MKIEYTTPPTDAMKVAVCTTSPDGETSSVVAPESALCTYMPVPFKGIRDIPVGKFKAVGDSGRIEEASVVFDLKRGEFVIKPKQLVADGFAFDKPFVPEQIPAPTPPLKTAHVPVIHPAPKPAK